jgi:hypothetical protein
MTTLLAIPVAGFTCVAKQRSAWREKLAQLDKQDVETLKQLVDDVESIREELGRTPGSQSELESILGRPLPKVHDGGYPTSVNYRRTGEDSYTLQYELWATDDWIFDSANPDAGWVQHFY